MPYRRSLRFRLIFSYLALSGAVAGLLLAILFVSLESIEEQLVNEHVLDELAYFRTLTEQDNTTTELHTNILHGYKLENEEKSNDYPFLSSLKPGLNHVKHNDTNFVVGVDKENNYSYYVLYDITRFENQEKLLISIFMFITLGAALGIVWYGATISRKLIAPVTNLAGQVRGLAVKNPEKNIASGYANDEVGELANAFDNYLARINQFLEREHNFTADTSHELRTPLAVILGAVELMLSQSNELPEQAIKPLLRIERAANDMQHSLSALLYLAREMPIDENIVGSTDLVLIIDNALEVLTPNLLKPSVQIKLEKLATPMVVAPESLIQVLLGNLIRNAMSYCQAGSISIVINTNSLIIEDTGIGISKKDLPHIHERGYRGENNMQQGIGLGLSIVKRICDRFNWKLEIESQIDKGTRVIWKF